MRSLAVLAACVVGATASTSAYAGAKDESAAEWLAPKWLNEWRDGLAAKGLNFGATWIGDNITNVSGGTKRGAGGQAGTLWELGAGWGNDPRGSLSRMVWHPRRCRLESVRQSRHGGVGK